MPPLNLWPGTEWSWAAKKRVASRRPIEIPRTYKIGDKNVLELAQAHARAR